MRGIRVLEGSLSPGDKSKNASQRECIERVTDAKSAATRARRLQTALEWMAGGKSRNWKYILR